MHCWARRRGDRGPHPSRNADRAADTAAHSTQMLLWHTRQKEKNEINHEAHKSQFPRRNRLLLMSLQPLLGCTGLGQGSTWIWMEQNQPSSGYPTLGTAPGSEPADSPGAAGINPPRERAGRGETNKPAGSSPIPADLGKVNPQNCSQTGRNEKILGIPSTWMVESQTK